MKKLLIALLLAVSTSTAYAETMPQFDENEPQITIRRGTDATYYEYRINGELREIKVVPSAGKPYYLVPASNGDMRRADKSELLIPKWVLFRW